MEYIGTYFKVTDEEITATGKVEIYLQSSRDEAVLAALYTHRLHNGNAHGSMNGVITCPSCGQIAITQLRVTDG